MIMDNKWVGLEKKIAVDFNGRWWNDTDRGKLKYWEKNIIQRVW
jgi:hypothetical protein